MAGAWKRHRDFRLQDHVESKGCCEEINLKRGASARASGCFQALKKDPYEMGLRKGNVEIAEG